MDGHDPVLDLPDAPQVLPLHPRRVVAPLPAAGLVDHPDGAEGIRRRVREDRPQVLLEDVAGGGVVPLGGGQELLEGADGRPGLERDGLDRLAGQIGQEAAAVGVEVGGGAVLAEASAEPPEVARERRPEGRDFLFRHRYPSR